MKTILYAELDEGDTFVHPLTGYRYIKTTGLMCENLDVYNDECSFDPQEKIIVVDNENTFDIT